MLFTFVVTLLVVNCMSKKTKIVHDASDSPISSISNLRTHPRITENCREKFEGNEGAEIKAFQLKQVFIVTTPGLLIPDISSDQSNSYEPNEYLHFCDFTKSEIINNYLEILMIKNKLPGKAVKPGFKAFYSLPVAENCRNQRLSSFGVSQLINLGKYLLKSYHSKLKCLDMVQPHPGLAVTWGDETLYHSLSALLYGLLTEKQFVYTHIEKSPSDFSDTAQLKSTYQDLHYFMEQSFTKEHHLLKDTKVYPVGSSITESNESSKHTISHLSNNLCPTFSDQSVVEVNVSDQEVSSIFNVSDFHNRYLTNSSLFQMYSIARSFSLRQLVKNWLSPSSVHQNPSSGSASRNNDLKIITVDDLFFISFLTAINLPVFQHVSPTSRLIIESFMSRTPNSVIQREDVVSSPAKEIKSDSLIVQGQVRNIQADKPGNSKFENTSGKNILINEVTSEKEVLNESLGVVYEGESMNSEIGRTSNDVPLLRSSPSLKMRAAKESITEKNIAHNVSNSQQGPMYVRILYDGQEVTSFIPGCEKDPQIRLGICSFKTVEILLDRIQWQRYPVRDEL